LSNWLIFLRTISAYWLFCLREVFSLKLFFLSKDLLKNDNRLDETAVIPDIEHFYSLCWREKIIYTSKKIIKFSF